jgi:hypothetical protein
MAMSNLPDHSHLAPLIATIQPAGHNLPWVEIKRYYRTVHNPELTLGLFTGSFLNSHHQSLAVPGTLAGQQPNLAGSKFRPSRGA